jgi:hypothetical protein
MKSILFCTSYIRHQTEWDARYGRWLAYYSRVDLGAEKMLLIDDCSPFVPDPQVIASVDSHADITKLGDKRLLLKFQQRLGRSAVMAYPGWWRSFLHSVDVARQLGARKIIHIESDAFILSPRLLDYIAGLEEGWTTLWSPHYRMPETAIQVICEDQFENMAAFRQRPQCELDGRLAEALLPFTQVNRDFKGDRYGEFRRNRWIFRSRKFDAVPLFKKDFFWHPIPVDADFASQVTERQWQTSTLLKSL